MDLLVRIRDRDLEFWIYPIDKVGLHDCCLFHLNGELEEYVLYADAEGLVVVSTALQVVGLRSVCELPTLRWD